MSIADKLNLALTTKSQIKEKLRISDNVYSHYPSIVQKYVDNNPTKTSTDGVCNDALALPIYDFKLVGNTIQNGTPSPTAPKPMISLYGTNVLDLTKFYIDESQTTLNGGAYTVNNGVISIDGTNATGWVTVRSKNISSNKLLIPKGTYYFGVSTNGLYDNTGSNVQFSAGVRTLTSDYYMSQWFAPCRAGNTSTTALVIRKDGKTDYIPNGSIPVKQGTETLTTVQLTSPLNKIGDLEDYVDFQNNKIVRKIGKVVLDSSINVTVFGGSTYEFRAYAGTNVKNGGAVKCNVLQSSTADTMWGKRNTAGNNLIATTSGNSFLIMINDLTTASTVKNKLAELNTEILYELAEPVEEDMTLPDITLEEGDNTFTADSNITANWEIKYIADKDTVSAETPSEVETADVQLDKMSTPVTIRAMTSIPQWARFYGVPNQGFNPSIVAGETLTNAPDIMCEDLMVGVAYQPSIDANRKVQIFLLNEETSIYESVAVTLPTSDDYLTIKASSTSNARINEDGTLILISASATINSTNGSCTALVVLEIDKENRTAIPYIAGNVSSASNILLSKNIVMTNGAYVAKYSQETHKLTAYSIINGIPNSGSNYYGYYNPLGYRWIDDSTLLSCTRTTLMRFAFNDSANEVTYSKNALTLTEYAPYIFRYDLSLGFEFIPSSKTVKFVTLDKANLTVTEVARYNLSEDITLASAITSSTYNNKTPAPYGIDGNYILIGNRIYDITNITTKAPTLIYTHSTGIDIGSGQNFKLSKFYSSSAKKIFSFPTENTSAQYLAYANMNENISSNKIYGIATENMEIGQESTARLIFSNLEE